VVKAGDIVKVKVMEVDVQRKRIALSMRLNDEPGQDSRPARSDNDQPRNAQPKGNQPRGNNRSSQGNGSQGGGFNSAFADAFAKAKR
jgi:uncharacterized protein